MTLRKQFVLLLSVAFTAMVSCADSPEAKRPAKVETLMVENITDFSAMCRGRITDEGSVTISRYGIELDDGNGYVTYFRTEVSGTNFGVQLTGLSPNIRYKYRAFVDDGTVQHGEEKEFTTLSAIQSTASVDPITITGSSAIVYFSLVMDRYKEWGVYYSETVATSDDPFKKESSQANIIIEGLKNNITYSVLPYIIDNESNEIHMDRFSFTTKTPTDQNETSVHNTHPIAQLRYIKYHVVRKVEPYYTAYKRVINDVNDIINSDQKEKAVENFDIPPYYQNKEGHRAAVAALVDDSYAAYACALAYRLSGDKEYGEKAIYFMNAWAKINKTYTGSDGHQAMARAGCGLVIAAELMHDTELWCATERNQFTHWVANVYKWAGNDIRNRKNNVGDWGRYASLLSTSLTGNRAGADENIRMMKSDLFDKIAPDGHMPDEVSRGSTGTWYTYFSLSPMTAAAWVAYNMTGENFFEMESAEGASIKKAVDYLLYYAINPGEWLWDPSPERGTPSNWPGNLVEALYGIYKDPSYTNYVSGSRPIVYNTHHFTWTFPTLMPLSLTGYEVP